MLVDVAVPEMSLNSLTYDCPVNIRPGVRVIVEVGRSLHAGFVLGQSEKDLPPSVKVKAVEGVIDDVPVIPPDIWELSLWAGRVCMCGNGAAMKALIPRPVYMGEKVNPPPEREETPGKFTSRTFFNPLDNERVNFFLAELNKPGRTLILFPQKEAAKEFFMSLPDDLKTEALLWPSNSSPKLWQAWRDVHAGKFRIVVAPPGGIAAPLSPQRIIIEDEASPAYVLPYTLNISARSLAGQRASYLQAEFITAGRIPSLKTYVRTSPTEHLKPDRKNIILADIHASHKEQVHGTEGHIPLTFSLIKHTYRELAQSHSVIWILDRTGGASEVFCGNCGGTVKCLKCGAAMQAVSEGSILRCRKCGAVRVMPDKCESCGYGLLSGRRPGLDALAEIAGRYCNDVHVYDGGKSSGLHGLILSTRRGLELCGRVKPGLIAWLDLDAELRGQAHTTRYNVFMMLWESYWRGRDSNSGRKVLVQSRMSGMRLAVFLSQGWGKFIPDELKSRREFILPPYGYITELEFGSKIAREEMIDSFMAAGIFVMDPGDDKLPIYVNTESLDAVRKILEPKLSLRNSIKITVRSE